MTQNEHFTFDGAQTPTAPGRFVDASAIEPVEFIEGLTFRPALGERMMANYVSFAEHTRAPLHAHEEEQIVVVLEGQFEFEIDGEVRTMKQGEMAVIPAWVPHGAHTEDTTCLEVDIFNPPRRTLLDHAAAQAARSTHVDEKN
jgi:quercetin dioxygenase-like cupin family protein